MISGYRSSKASQLFIHQTNMIMIKIKITLKTERREIQQVQEAVVKRHGGGAASAVPLPVVPPYTQLLSEATRRPE